MRWEQMSLTGQILRDKSIMKVKCVSPCAICSAPTCYIDFCSEQRICSEECMSKQNNMISEKEIEIGGAQLNEY